MQTWQTWQTSANKQEGKERGDSSCFLDEDLKIEGDLTDGLI